MEDTIKIIICDVYTIGNEAPKIIITAMNFISLLVKRGSLQISDDISYYIIITNNLNPLS